MVKAAIPEDLFIHEFTTIGPKKLAKKYGLNSQRIFHRRRAIERKHNITLAAPQTSQPQASTPTRYAQEAFPGRLTLSIADGVAIVAGDAHYWPGLKTPLMHRALIHFLERFKKVKALRAMIMNGDVCDFASISRWPHVDWAYRPTVKDEIDIALLRMQEIEEACGPTQKLWPLGNHDARFSMYVATHAEKLEGIESIQLKDHFPRWKPCWSVEINDGFNTTVIKHTFKGGMHAPRNNVLNAGCHFITNHLHSAKVTPLTTRHHTFYGVDTGCIADTYGPQFLYAQDNPRDWRSAFCILTYKNSKLLQPELVVGWDENHVQFRGEIIKV